MSFPKKYYGAALAGQHLATTRSTRTLTGKIIHSALGREEQRNLKDQPVAGCIGVHASLTLWLDTPFPSKAKALKILPSMLDVQLPFPLEDCCYCFVQFRRKTPQTLSVLAVAARRAAIQQRLEQYQAAGLDPLIMDHEGLALWEQSLREKHLQTGASRVIFNLESDHLAVVIGKGIFFLNAHSFQASAATIKSAETLSGIRRILAAELQSPEKVEWLFCGSLAAQPEVVAALHDFLNKEWPGPMLIHQAPESFLARALSARALARGRFKCNLRQGLLTHPRLKAEHKRRVAHTLALFLLTGALLCGFNLAWQIIGSIQFNHAKQTISSLAKELSPERAITYGRETGELQPIINKRLADLAPALNIFAQPLSIRLAEIIKAGQTADLSFNRLELTRAQLLIAGTAEDWDYCEALVKYLKNLGYQVELQRQEAEDDNGVSFTVKGTKLEIENRKSPRARSAPESASGGKIENSLVQP